jgi:hypothetical protein
VTAETKPVDTQKQERILTFERVGDVWHATMQTPDGPLTAIGATLREARLGLESLIRTWEASAATPPTVRSSNDPSIGS